MVLNDDFIYLALESQIELAFFIVMILGTLSNIGILIIECVNMRLIKPP